MIKQILTLAFLSMLLAAQLLCAENSRNDLLTQIQNLSDEAISSPISTLKKLERLVSEIDSSDHKLYLSWLVKKAESSNYSYQFDLFEQTISQAIGLINDGTPHLIRARIFLYQGMIHQRAGRYSEASEYFIKASSIADREKDSFISASAQIEQAFNLALTEAFEPALKQIQSAYLIADDLKDHFLLARIDETYGVIYLYMDKPIDSLAYFNQALTTYQKLEYPFHIAETTLGIATVHRRNKAWEPAIEWFDRFFEAARPIASPYSDFYFNYGLGMTLAEKNDCDSALLKLNKALEMTGFSDYKTEIYKRKADCQISSGLFNEAENSIEKAQFIYQQIPALQGTSWQLEVLRIRAQLAAAKGDFQQGVELLERYYQQMIAINRKNNSQKLMTLKQNMQFERERLETDMLTKQAQLQKLELAEQRRKNELQQTWLFGSLLLILFISGFVFWQLRISRQLKSLSMTDELTGLNNRRFMFNTLSKLLTSHYDKPVFHSLMLIDVDELKPINDTYGHQDGDKVLKMVAEAGSTVLRYDDVFARVGGDEFMLLVARAAPDQEVIIANRIIRCIHETPVVTKTGEIIHASVSIGIVSIKDHNESIENLYTRVDEALYRAKKRGRNCISH